MRYTLRRAKWWLVQLLSFLRVVDRDYYLKRYPDVELAGIDPVEHYVTHGFREGRHANRFHEKWMLRRTVALRLVVRRMIAFDAQYYLSKYPDVVQAGSDPLVHFTRYGLWEGRAPNRWLARHAATHNAITSLLSLLTGHASPEGHELLRSLAFSLAKGGRRRGAEATIRLHALAMHRKGTKNALVGCLPIADIANRSYPWVEMISVEPARPYSFREPEIVGEDSARPVRTVEVPRKWVASIANAQIIGGFQVIAQNHFVLYEPAGDPRSDFVAGSWPYVAGVSGAEKAVAWYEYDRREAIPEGILISGRCSPNYYHWLIEYLTRVYIALPIASLHGVPLIVDAAMYAQEFESLAAVCPNWPVHVVQPGTLLDVGRLHIPAIPTYLPDTLQIPFWQASALCDSTLEFIRKAVFNHYKIKPLDPRRKIFLARRGARNITNTTEIEELLTKFGFECIDTGALSFAEQVALFSSASIIVGPLGAAFSNVIFCDSRCKILGLASPYAKHFCMQANLAAFAGCEYKILAGEHPSYKSGDEHVLRDVGIVHESFSISPHSLTSALTAWDV
ncbi:glycosyltransferase family 61 protein [Burkholderia stagnalis]|uniref:glycosyltransferase family 61 protein n=1 Tax=Burkholderia stagnalis TaxID=1503054 RepID=UPI0009BCBD85|nr:glycosyltransferase family 61 protein [Burkholderia stagnalis]